MKEIVNIDIQQLARSRVCLLSTLVFLCFFVQAHAEQDNLMFFNVHEIEKVTGFDEVSSIERNYNGDKLIIKVFNDNSRIRLLYGQCQVETRDMPARNAFLNFNEEFILWSENLSQEIEIKGGYRIALSETKAFRCIDPSGTYFILSHSKGTDVIPVSAPDTILLTVNEYVDKIYFFNKKIYLFSQLVEQKGKNKAIKGIKGITLFIDHVNLKRREEFFITRPVIGPSPFVIEDMDWVNEKIIIRDVQDESPDIFYQFDIGIRKLSKVGECDGVARIMKEDVLNCFPAENE